MQPTDYLTVALQKHKRTVRGEIDRLHLLSSSLASDQGIEKTIARLHDYATAACNDSAAFGHFRFDMAVYAHKYILQYYPNNETSKLYVAQLSSDY